MFFNKSKNNILKMTQENLRVTQENNEIIHSFLKKYLIQIIQMKILKFRVKRN